MQGSTFFDRPTRCTLLGEDFYLKLLQKFVVIDDFDHFDGPQWSGVVYLRLRLKQPLRGDDRQDHVSDPVKYLLVSVICYSFAQVVVFGEVHIEDFHEVELDLVDNPLTI